MTTNLIEKNIMNTLDTHWTYKKFDVALRNIVKMEIYKQANIFGDGFRYEIDVTDNFYCYQNFDLLLTAEEQNQMKKFGEFDFTNHGYRKFFVITGDDENLLDALEELFDIIG